MKHRLLLKPSLTRYITIVIVVAVALVSVSSLGINLYFVTRKNQAQFEQKSAEYLAYLKESLEIPLWNYDTSAAVKLGRMMMANDIVASLTIRDSKNEDVFVGRKERESEDFVENQRVQYQDVIVGTLELGLTKRLYRQQQWRIAVTGVLTTLLLIASIYGVVTLLVRRFLKRPLAEFYERIDAIAKGDYQQGRYLTSYVELEGIMARFNQMASRVKNREAALVESNRALRQEIGEREKAEEENKELQKQLLQLQKMEAIGTLAGGIAHDFNNILSGIIGYAELAETEAKSVAPQLQTYLKRISEAGFRARDLVAQILRFSRQGSIEKVTMNLAPLLKECVKLLESVLPTTIQVEVKPDAAEDTIWADPTQIHQVIMNLGTNAYHSMRTSGGILTFHIENTKFSHAYSQLGLTIIPGAYVKLSVSDTGAGIPPHLRERVFDPYFSTKEINEGTGLGLSVSHGIISAHQGLIEIEETSDKGTTFAVYLPVADEHRTVQTAETPSLVMGNGEHILVADDEDFSRDVMGAVLAKSGYTVTSCRDGSEALEMLRRFPERFHLVISDQTMPEITGVQLASEARRLNARLPIILCTGYSETVNERTAAFYGITRFLMKPVSGQELLQAVHECILSTMQ